MRYLDFGFQALIIGLVAGISVFDWTNGRNPMLLILIGQLVLGPWQMLSALISVISESPLYRYKKLHLMMALPYLLVLALMVSDVIPLSGNEETLVLTIPAWALAGYYFYITVRWTFTKTKKSGTFLPNVFF